MGIKEYKCPNCGGVVKFDSSTQSMKCPFCDAEFEIAALEEHQKDVSANTEDNYGWDAQGAGQEWDSDELNNMIGGACPSCGAEILGDKNTVATSCPNCGNTQIVVRRLEGELKPDYIIPFKLEKKAATDALIKFYNKKRLLPNCFKKGNRVSEVQGVYLPFWLFDAVTEGHINYKATRTKVWMDRNYKYVKTDFYSVVRDGSLGFEKVPVDGSEKMDDAYMDSLEPFDYEKMEDFQTAYLSGYIAEKYDEDADKCKERAGKRMKATVETEFRKSVTGYQTVIKESSTVNVKDGKVNYSLFPVWILNTKYKKENYMFLMNGQTGLFIGRLPVDKGKFFKYLALFTGIIGGSLTLIIQALNFFM